MSIAALIMLSFETMSTTRRKSPRRPSKEQVRAWLTTVIAPVASALAVEQDRSSRGNWSFRCVTRDFEFLWPVPMMVAIPYLPNLEQLMRYRDDFKELAQAHDGALDELRVAARVVSDRTLQSERFRTLAASWSTAERDREYFAEYIVNGLRDLASHYVHHELWTRQGATFLGLREDPALTNEFRSLEATGQKFLKCVTSMLATVNRLQVELADSYQLPPVDPSDVVRV